MEENMDSKIRKISRAIKKFQIRKYLIISSILLGNICICTGCNSNNKDTSSLLILEEDYADSAEETQEEITEAEITSELVEQEEAEESIDSIKITQTEESNTISVYICGAIHEPGVYELEVGSRIYHVVEEAGGMTQEAMTTYLNQAQELVDGQKIYVPTVQEVEEGTVDAFTWSADSSGTSISSSGNESVVSDGSDKVNINTATQAELMTLPSIGESKANSIIEYREANGGFNTIEDLMNITGIKDGVFSQVEAYITVG